jgi:hypothetical protein
MTSIVIRSVIAIGAYPVKYMRSGPGVTSSPVNPSARACSAPWLSRQP